MNVLRFEDVRFDYGGPPVLRGISLSIAAGETVALLGPNGAGKTTLTKLIVALLQPTAGIVRLAGRSIERKVPEQLARQVAYVFQHPDQQLFQRTVAQEVAFGPHQRGLSSDDVAEVVRSVLAQTGLTSLAEEHPHDLPPAQRKLVALAAALAQEPRLLVLDEPTQGLDRSGMHRVCRVVAEVVASGVAVLAVTHDLAFVAEALERTVVLVEGQVVHDGPTSAFLLGEVVDATHAIGAPPAAHLSAALALPGQPIRIADVGRAVASRLG
jgi:energy-coupling factor transport system ATP-binding protein